MTGSGGYGEALYDVALYDDAAAFRTAVTEGHVYARQLFVCTGAGVILEELPIDPASSLQVGGNLVRRSGTLVIPNRQGRYTPTSGGLIDFGRAYLLRFVIVRPDGSQLIHDQPLLFPDSDEVDIRARTVSIAVSDGMRIVGAEAQLTVPATFPDGTALEDVVRAILVACGAPDEDASFSLDAHGAHLVGDAGYEAGTRWQDILNELLTTYSLDLWAAAPCVYTLRPIPDPTTQTPVATWQRGSQVRLLEMRVTRTTLARNHAIVSGIDPFGRPFTVEAFDLNPASPVMYGLVGVGDLSVHVQSDSVTTLDQAMTLARSLLVIYGTQRTFDASLPVDPSLERRDVVRVIEPETSTDSLVMLDSFPIPIAPGAQQFSVIEARSIA